MTKIYLAETLRVSDDELKAALNKLPRWRSEKLSKYKNGSDKVNGAFAYLLLEKLMLDAYGGFDSAPFTYNPYGKPFFSSSNIFFSLSHCRGFAAAAVSECEIGLDIMDKRPVSEDLVKKICTENERRLFDSAADKQKFLLRLWCEKESLAKKRGTGFTEGFKAFDTAVSPAEFFTETSEYCLALSGDSAAEVKELDCAPLIQSLPVLCP